MQAKLFSLKDFKTKMAKRVVLGAETWRNILKNKNFLNKYEQSADVVRRRYDRGSWLVPRSSAAKMPAKEKTQHSFSLFS